MIKILVPRVFIGFDSREEEAFNVLKYSILKHSPYADIRALVQSELREKGIYTREKDNAATEFSLTRFLVPYLMDYKGYAVFIDCDMLWTINIAELGEYAEDNKECAVNVVKHNHQPCELVKMDNQKQTVYPRKNWSSVMLFNCGHEKNKNLTPEVVNSVQPSFLHRFEWLRDELIGELPITFNFLVDYYKKLPDNILPSNIHFTSGGPWFDEHKDCDYSEIWFKYRDEMKG